MRKNCFSKKQFNTPPPPEKQFLHQFFVYMLEIAWNAKKTWNFEKKKKYFFKYLKNS